MATELCKIQIGYPYEALEAFGVQKGNQLPIVCIPTKGGFPGCSIPFGTIAYKQSGAVIVKEPLTPGWHWMLPWESVAFLATPQYTFYDVPVKSVPTKDNVYVGIDVILVFRIIDAHKVYFKVGVEKLANFLKNAQEETVRSIAQSTCVADVFDLILINESEYVKEMNDKFVVEYGLEITDMMVTEIKLPPEIGIRLQNETTFGVNERFQKRKQEFDVLKNKNAQEVENLKMNAQNQRLKYEQEQISKRSLINKAIEEEKARMQQRITEIDFEAKRVVDGIKEESKDFAQKKDMMKNSILLEIRAQTNATIENLKIEAVTYETQVKSKTDMEVAKLRAQALNLIANAEEKAVKQLAQKRDFDRQMSEMKTLNSMTSNKNLVVQGSTGGNVIAQIQGSIMEKKLYNE